VRLERPSLLAWSCAAAGTALAAAGALIALLGNSEDSGFLLFFVLALPLVVSTAVVGGLVASRRPRNPIGWILSGFSLFMGLAALASGFAQVAPDEATHGAGQLAAWFANSSWVALFTLAIFVLLLFPNGRLVSPRWRLPAWCGAIGTACLAAGSAVDPGRLVDFPQVENPFPAPSAVAVALQLVGATLTIFALGAAVTSMVVRYRRAGATARNQLKWLAAAAVFTAAGVAVGIALGYRGAITLGNSVVLVSILPIPVAIGIGILRYRLYDVDRVISRSLTYALVTVTLAGAYAVLVLLGQTLFSAVAGGSDLAIALSTLVVAALFLPVRARLQRFVDRRFYRRRYDARRTIDAFGARLRDEVELAGLRSELESAVHETMQPAHVSLWLRRGATW
jgi:hypothetical protein